MGKAPSRAGQRAETRAGAAPTLREDAFLPPRLRDLLRQRFATGMLLVQAPAGCGKTAVVVQFLQDAGIEPRWYTCGADDAEPSALLGGIVTAMGGTASIGGQTTLAALASTDARQSFRTALKPFLDDLDGAVPVASVLVVDDADAILDSPSALDALDFLFSACAPAMRIILLSRAELPLGSQAKRLLEGRAARVMAEDLLFRSEEIGAFASAVFGVELSDEEADRLYRATGGWAIALGLSLRLRGFGTTMQSDEHAQFTPEARADLFAYLAAEVLSRVDERISTFLRRTAILDTLDPAVCARITSEERPAELLQSLAAAGLPVMKAGWSTYRCHSLLREYFLSKLTSDELSSAHIGAAEAFRDGEDFASALTHFVSAGDAGGALDLADQHGADLFRSGRGRALVDLAKAMPPQERAAHYRALFWAAFAASRMFDWDWAAEALTEVEAVATQQGDPETARQALGTLAYMFNVWGRFELAAAAARRLINMVPEGERASRAAAALGHLVPGMTGSGEFRAAVELIRLRAPELAAEPRAAIDAEAFARAVAAVTLARDGDFAEARAQLSLADNLAGGCTDGVVRTQIPWTRAMTGFLGGDPFAAEAAARETETLALQLGDLQRVLECRALLAMVHLVQGQGVEAERGFAQVEELRAGVTNFWVTILTLLSRPRRLHLAGDGAGALAAAESNHALATGVGEAWFVCFTRLEVIYFRLLAKDSSLTGELSLTALREAESLAADLLLYGAHLMRAASSQEDEVEMMAEALRIADARDYRFLMPYVAQLPQLDAALWRAMDSPWSARAAMLLVGSGPTVVKAFRAAASGLSQQAQLGSIDVLARLGFDGRAALQDLAASSSREVSAIAKAALATLDAANPHRLSPREREILELLSQGLRTKDVAAKLYLTPATVSTHIQRIMTKTNTTSRAELLALAAREGAPPVN